MRAVGVSGGAGQNSAMLLFYRTASIKVATRARARTDLYQCVVVRAQARGQVIVWARLIIIIISNRTRVSMGDDARSRRMRALERAHAYQCAPIS